jgi:hypothetical protein
MALHAFLHLKYPCVKKHGYFYGLKQSIRQFESWQNEFNGI